jgi:hypothetical protein
VVLRLIDLIVAWVLLGVGGVAGRVAAVRVGVKDDGSLSMLSIASAAVVMLTIAPIVYRWLHLFPLYVPRCPHCGHRPAGYWIRQYPAWPSLRIKCGGCQGETDLLLAKGSFPPDAAEARLVLRWPQFVGIWKRVV